MKEKKQWWKHGVIYQIYPRSFQDTNADGIGDLNGIIQRLDYLQDLGIDGIWLSPIMPSPDADFGYDVSDYHTIDPKYGNLQDFDRLLKEAHKRGIHILMDLVLNHTSDQHRWFQESRMSRTNPYHDWYIWRDASPDGSAPNNWKSAFGGPAWEFDEKRGQYYLHLFTKEQPDLNWRNPDVRAAMLDIFRYWLDKGVDGFRLDVFNAWYKDAELRDNPRLPGLHRRPFESYAHIYDVSQPEMIPALQDIRKIMDAYPDRYVVGETFLADSAHARTYIGEDRLHAGFDYAYANSPFSARAFGKAIQYWDSLHEDQAWPNYFLNNHDTPRSSTRYAGANDDARLKLLAAMHLTVRGTPYLYYGEEIGMRDVSLTRAQLKDPVGRRYWPFNKGRDGCRSPMQWDARAFAGFSTAETWLPVHSNYKVRNVANQAAAPASLLNFYKSLIALRRQRPALHAGKLNMVDAGNDSLLVYKRATSEETMLVVLNFSKNMQSYTLPVEDFNQWDLVFTGNEPITSHMTDATLDLPPYGLAILLSRAV
jgi:alpha-glucosidase